MFTQKEIVNGQFPVINLDIIDLVQLDHQFLRTCLETIVNEAESNRKRKSALKKFIHLYEVHANAEKNSLYRNLKNHEEFHFQVLEAESSHAELEKKMHLLIEKIGALKELSPALLIEIRLIVKEILDLLKDEEEVLLSELREKIDDHFLNEIGAQYMKIRSFTIEELGCIPFWSDQVISWEDSAQKLSFKLQTRMDHEGTHH